MKILFRILTIILMLVIAVSPVLASDDLLTDLKQIGCYQIPLSKAVAVTNARNAILTAKVIDKKVVKPGEVFSYGKAIGPITAKRGFIKGKVARPTRRGIVYSYTYGAGICMTSSALYQAVKNAGLKTIERHNHVVQTPYLKLGEDAAIWQDIKDYKFRNTKTNPIMINAGTNKGNLYITISEIVPKEAPLAPESGTVITATAANPLAVITQKPF